METSLYTVVFFLIGVLLVSVFILRRRREPKPFGFILVRHVMSEETSQYWKVACQCIRNCYGDSVPIVIIDDNSKTEFCCDAPVDPNCSIIRSDLPYRGEILGYYYMYKYRLFQKAVIMHDSIFCQVPIDFERFTNVKFLWHAGHFHDIDEREVELLHHIGNKRYIDFYHEKSKWWVCFGVMAAIELRFLDTISDIFRLLPYIHNRDDRMRLERIFACICTYHHPDLQTDPSFFHDIFQTDQSYEYTFSKYMDDAHRKPNLKFIKVWTGR